MAGRGHLAAGTNNLGMHRKPRSRRCRRRAAAEQQDTMPALQGLIRRMRARVSRRERERCYLTAFVAAGSMSWRMPPLSRPLIGSKSHESCGQMAGAAPGARAGGEEKKESFIPEGCTDPWGLGNKTAGSAQRLRGACGSPAARGTPREGGELRMSKWTYLLRAALRDVCDFKVQLVSGVSIPPPCHRHARKNSTFKRKPRGPWEPSLGELPKIETA